jgi:ribonuclease HII
MAKVKSDKNISILEKSFNNDINLIEIGIDEVGRGPMFGRVYVAAVILPFNSTSFNYSLLKDSKKFYSEKKIREVSNYIKENCINYSINWNDEKHIDTNNIRVSTLKAMHLCLDNLISKENNYYLLVDGNDFIPYSIIDNNYMLKTIDFKCIEGGDNKYCSIAAASILAKVARDDYIENLCKYNPKLNIYYDILKNKGYGTKNHLDGLIKHGSSCWHRKTFGINKTIFDNNEFPESKVKEAMDISEKEELKEVPII